MFDEVFSVIVTDGLWLMVAAGWILLIMIGLEVDKPLSGGIPGHVSLEDEHAEEIQEGLWGRIGVVSSWIVFCLVALSLPFVLYWIMVVHPR